MNPITQAQALKALDGMEAIVRNEMLVRGRYVSEEIVNEKLAAEGAICGGHQACAVGSLWIGGGIKIEHGTSGDAFLPGVEQEEREEFLRPRHGLRAAYNALNDAADAYIDRHGIPRDNDLEPFEASIEALFESSAPGRWSDDESTWIDGEPLVTRGALLRIIKSAKGRIASAR